MSVLEKGSHAVLAGAGFLTGFAWAVFRWAERSDVPRDAETIRTLLATGGPLSAGYAVLLALLFWPLLPSSRGAGLRMAVAPTAFALSAILGAVGIEAALSFVG